ncbi:MAG: DNA polymerase I, partial [bacterium]
MMSTNKPLLILVDGYGLIFRAFYTIKEMSHRGIPTNALFGFTSMLLKIVEQKPDALLVALDWHGVTHRKDLYPEYKSNREDAADDLKSQIHMLRDFITSLGISWMESEKHEADDVIGSLSKKAVDEGFEVEIVTGDHDLCQLVNDDVKILYTIRGTSEFKTYQADEVFERFGVTPEHLVDYKALVGDPSDNIPGVKGVGDKTAKKLLAEYADIDEIYEHLDDINPESLRIKLEAFRDDAFLSRELATIQTDLDLNLPKDLSSSLDHDGALKAFTELGFNAFINRLGLDDLPTPDTEEKKKGKLKANVVQTIEELEKILKKIEKNGEFAIDLETSSLDVRSTKLVGIALSIDSWEGWYIPVGHHDSGDLLSIAESHFSNLPINDVLARIKPLLESENIKKIAQNAKFEYLVLLNHGITLNNISFDTMIASYILNPDHRHNLKELGLKWLAREMRPISELIGSGKKQISMQEVSIENVSSYAVDDVTVTWELAKLFKDEIKNVGMESLYYEIELPVVTLLAEMENEGIRVDANVLREISAQLEKDINKITEQSVGILGKEVNLNSPKQLSELLFKELNLPDPKKGSTSIEVLEEIRESHPIIPLVIDYRSIMKIRSTYAEGLLGEINQKDGRIHTSFNQTMTSTGRLSSSNPNLQNIPVRTEKGRLIRKAFVPNSDDEVLLSADYSQIELRLLAHYSGDDVLIKAFESGEDIHTRTAREILPLENGVVTSNDRRTAKIVNFGVIYGMSAFSLSKELGITRKRAQEFIDHYFARYPKVRIFFNDL